MKKTAFLITATIIFLVSAIAACEPIQTMRPNLRLIKVSHRGAAKFAPENTLPSINKALEFGMDFIEMDIQYTKDGVPVLMHDETVDRTTDGNGTVRDMTLEEIRKLDAGARGINSDKFKNVKVPTLDEVLVTIGDRAGVYIDQKAPPEPVLLDLLKKHGFYPDRTVIVGGLEYQSEFLELDPDAPVMPYLSDPDDIHAILEKFPSAVAFNTMPDILSKKVVELAHERGIMIFMNTLGWNDREPVMRKIINYGVDAIQTDHPDILVKTVDKMKKAYESKETTE